MDLANLVSLKDFSQTNQCMGLFEDAVSEFDGIMQDAYEDNQTIQDLLPKLMEAYGDVDDFEEFEPQYYMNFKDLVITEHGIRGLTDSFWSWGIAFSYLKETGVLYINTREEGNTSFNSMVEDLSGEIKEALNAMIEAYTTSFPNGVVITLEGEYVL